MKDLVTLVSGIEFKTRGLVSKLNDQACKNQELKKENALLHQEIESLNKKIKQLEYSNRTIKIAKALERVKGAKNSKLLINELLREVDRSIGLLND